MIQTLPMCLLLVAVLLGACETPPPRHGEVVVRDREYDVRVVFTDRDRAIIRDWYEDRRRSLPPGLAKKGKLPPGHAKRWGPRESLPPGLTYRHLPPELERRLSRLPEGYARVIIETDIYIVNTRSRVIFDLFQDIVID